MPEISADVVRQLREETNAGMMDCKRALTESGGDKQKAIRILRERGMAIAAKKASREAKDGMVESVVLEEGRVASLVAVGCETDFVARNDNFRSFVKRVAERAAAADEDLAETMKAEFAAKIAEIGENTVLRRQFRYVAAEKGRVFSYIHLGSKLGVLLELAGEKSESTRGKAFIDAGKDLTLHIAASSPKCIRRDEVPADLIAAEREIYAKQAEGKPAAVIEKIVEGRLNKKFFCEICLLEQPFVKDPAISVSAMLEAKGQELGDKLTVRRFIRYQLGE